MKIKIILACAIIGLYGWSLGFPYFADVAMLLAVLGIVLVKGEVKQ